MNDLNELEGILVVQQNREAMIWAVPYEYNQPHLPVPREVLSRFRLESGTRVKVALKNNRPDKLLSICGQEPADFADHRQFRDLISVNPDNRFDFSSSSVPALRIMDLFVPLGKGSRALIVSPPRAGKTVLLEQLARQFHESESETRMIALLIDERPEEVTSFRRNTDALVFSSTLDKSSREQVALANLLIKHITLEVECGNDVIILLDSLTRLGRAFNRNDTRSQGRTMSGGLGSGALEIPRKLFGLARNIQQGGSCTIIATILTDTGSRMDEIIFQEFKGTGNSELILDRNLAEERIFPALNLRESGTRKDELLIEEDQLQKIHLLRRKLLRMDDANAINYLLTLLEKYPDNNILLNQLD